MKPVLIIIIGVWFASSGAAAAQTVSERTACKRDVLRLCTAAQIATAMLGDHQGIYDCFRQHRGDLSRTCDRVLRQHGY